MNVNNSVGKVQVTTMLKKLFDFKLSKPLLIAKIFMLLCYVAAIVILCFGIKEILDVAHMKSLLETTKPTFGMILDFLAKKYLIWAIPVMVIGTGAYLVTRFMENNKKA